MKQNQLCTRTCFRDILISDSPDHRITYRTSTYPRKQLYVFTYSLPQTTSQPEATSSLSYIHASPEPIQEREKGGGGMSSAVLSRYRSRCTLLTERVWAWCYRTMSWHLSLSPLYPNVSGVIQYPLITTTRELRSAGRDGPGWAGLGSNYRAEPGLYDGT